MNATKTTYQFIVKSIVIMIGFLVLVLQPLLVTVNLISNSKHKICFVDFDSDGKEKQEQDFNEDYLFVETELFLLVKHITVRSKICPKMKISYSNFISEVVIPPPKVV